MIAMWALTACEWPSAGGPEPVPSNAYCQDVSAWPSALSGMEEDVFALVNARRAEGGNCGGEAFGPAAPLAYNGALICAARKHSKDMVTRGFFNHSNPDGDGPGERAAAAGFGSAFVGENIAAGQQTPDHVMSSWMDSAGHCSNILNSQYNVIGIGVVDAHWTQVFGQQ